MKIDILFLAHNRLEFTLASMSALEANTDWSLVNRLHKFIDAGDGGDDGTQNAVLEWHQRLSTTTIAPFGGPVPAMQEYLSLPDRAEVFAKIDNDTIVPPGWFEQCAAVMEQSPQLDLLGIEPPASRTPSPWARGKRDPAEELAYCGLLGVGYAATKAIGGLGFMRTSAFNIRPPMRPHSIYGGFTDWQLKTPRRLNIGWVVPPLRLFLLDRLPVEPWASLSVRYNALGWQRPWAAYSMAETAELASWWLD